MQCDHLLAVQIVVLIQTVLICDRECMWSDTRQSFACMHTIQKADMRHVLTLTVNLLFDLDRDRLNFDLLHFDLCHDMELVCVTMYSEVNQWLGSDQRDGRR